MKIQPDKDLPNEGHAIDLDRDLTDEDPSVDCIIEDHTRDDSDFWGRSNATIVRSVNP